VRLDPELGPIVEIDHGSGLATRYTMRRYGRADVAAGRRVAAGETIGELGEGLPDDLPFLEFAVLLDSGGARYSLDPSPFIFGDPAERSSPFATGVMNSAVRSDDEAQLSRLLALGIDPDGTALDHTRPLEWAVMEQNSRMARLLVAGGADPSAKTANDLGMVVEGLGLTLANTGPSLVEYAGESRNPELVAALSGT
jgi:hypothetical protein